jgi:hypothetical protein
LQVFTPDEKFQRFPENDLVRGGEIRFDGRWE